MRLTDALLGEHGVFYALFDHLLDASARAGSADEIRIGAAMLASALIPHARIENEVLFPALQARMGHGPDGLLGAMEQEHEEIEAFLGELARAPDLEEARILLERVIEATRVHFEKEEEALFPTALEILGDGGLRDLGGRWAELRKVRVR